MVAVCSRCGVVVDECQAAPQQLARLGDSVEVIQHVCMQQVRDEVVHAVLHVKPPVGFVSELVVAQHRGHVAAGAADPRFPVGGGDPSAQ